MDRDSKKLETWRLLRAGRQHSPALGEMGAASPIDLRGLRLGEVPSLRSTNVEGILARSISDDLRVERVDIAGVDLSGSDLRNLTLKHDTFQGCDFSSSDCRSWRVWASRFEDCSFRQSNLRKALLGGISDGQWTVFRRADLRGADLRGTIYNAAEFVDCDFTGANLVGIDFQGSRFTRCRFGGRLEEVIFYRRAPTVDVDLDNEMESVDFSSSTLRGCEFRGLTLSQVVLPSESTHMIIRNYERWIDQQLERLERRTDEDARALRAFLGVEKRWRGIPGAIGVLNKAELRQLFGNLGEEVTVFGEVQ